MIDEADLPGKASLPSNFSLQKLIAPCSRLAAMSRVVREQHEHALDISQHILFRIAFASQFTCQNSESHVEYRQAVKVGILGDTQVGKRAFITKCVMSSIDR